LHYLLGKGEPLTIDNESKWSRYMKASETLKGIVSSRLLDFLKNIDTNSVTNVDFAFQGFVDNGESITGYNYLHGTVESEGDFHITGTILRLEDGSFINALTFTWNDIIDPNYNYTTDQIKSKIGNVLSLGQAADYKIKIEWFSLSEISSDGQVKGWPLE
jgi:hypothetical protein